MRDGVEIEKMTINVHFWVPKGLDGERILAIFERFRPLHDQFMRIIEEECVKAGYIGIPVNDGEEGG